GSRADRAVESERRVGGGGHRPGPPLALARRSGEGTGRARPGRPGPAARAVPADVVARPTEGAVAARLRRRRGAGACGGGPADRAEEVDRRPEADRAGGFQAEIDRQPEEAEGQDRGGVPGGGLPAAGAVELRRCRRRQRGELARPVRAVRGGGAANAGN